METKTCRMCHLPIKVHKNGRPFYCKKCIKIRRNIQIKQCKDRQQIPTPARGRYWKYWKFLLTLTKDELKALFVKKKNNCKNGNVRELRAQMKLINVAYQRS
jgi:hypothetical protein